LRPCNKWDRHSVRNWELASFQFCSYRFPFSIGGRMSARIRAPLLN
jgi:hypothetical protein